MDVFACVRCGGGRRVLADVNEAGGERAMLVHLGLPPAGARRALAREFPQSAGC
ncbi:ATP-dependent helicase HrpA [Cystobacter fuscus]|nr:ATP-dependent helicase HrpA [Cystobacter fuscus]